MSITTRLTKQQFDLLRFMYSFRFVTTKQVQTFIGVKNIQQAQQRLKTLLDKQYVGRRYSSDDKLLGRYAAYFLMPDGMEIIKGYADIKALRLMRKDPTASQRFIDHNIAIGDVAYDFNRLYKDVLDRSGFQTKTDIMQASRYEYESNWDGSDDFEIMTNSYPKPMPDGFIDVWVNNGKHKSFHSYFIEVWHDSVPFWVYRKRILYFIEYTDDETWQEYFEGNDTPLVLLVCDTPALQRRVQRFLRRIYFKTSNDYQFLVTNRQTLAGAEGDDEIWTRVDDETTETLRLTEVSELDAE
jgi:hypothetical protein